ncbi:MAG: sugar-binding protein [Planctomycetota bacterium]
MRRNTLTLAAIAALLPLVGCSDATNANSRPRIAYVTNGVDPFWTVAEAGAKQAGEDLAVDVLVRMPSGGLVDQKQILEDLLTQGVDGIAVSPIDHVNQTSFLDDVATRVPLVTHDSDAPGSKRLAFVGMDNYDAGRMAGAALEKALPQGGEVMLFIGRLEQDNARLRVQGVVDELLDRARDDSRRDAPDAVLRGERYTVLGVMTDQFDKSVAKANAADALTAHPEIDAMVGLFAYNPPAILEALRQAGKLGTVTVVGFDEQDATLQGIVDGDVAATVVQDPYQYGYQSVLMLTRIARGDQDAVPASGLVDIPARTIGPAEVEAFWTDKKAKLGEK